MHQICCYLGFFAVKQIQKYKGHTSIITAHDTTFNGANTTCRFNSRFWPEPSYQFDESLIFSDALGGQCDGAIMNLPVPLQPGVYGSYLIFFDGFE
ncbi:hypothetical protein MNBD_GAMMA03-520 [hydrothermal vent metagenome]|uniref:Uncharacterized protein n=1 Tax=hydrothermal vent metagenome TaxID=652676 RepID=A0A3B0WE73_9ZZZZ